MSEFVSIVGPAGILEASLDRPEGGGRWAVLCHPHPLYGGNMNDAVLDAVSTALKGHDIGVLRFNFRGVGGSEGHHDGGTGESEDLAAVWAWLLANEGYSPTILGGYSFGASVAWATARKLPSLERVLLVAPPLGHMRFDGAPPACPVHLIYGDRDEFVDTAAARRMDGVTHHLIAGADHFFSGRWVDLATAADTALG